MSDMTSTDAVVASNTFSAGATLTSLLDQINDGTYIYYWTGTYPKVVPASSTPATTGGVGIGAWSIVGDAVLRANLASGSDGYGDALIAMKQPYTGASVRTQHDKNSETLSLMDAGVSRDAFDPSVLETVVKLLANQNRLPYFGAKQYAYPGQTLKVWNWLDSQQDRGTVLSLGNVTTAGGAEPTTQVTALGVASGLGQYSGRDFVGLSGQFEAPPALLTTSNTTFTSTTVTSADITSVSSNLRAGQFIDVTDSSGVVYSGWIKALSGTTVTVDTAWYVAGGNGTTGVPAAGSTAVFVPNTKFWGQNTNVILDATSDAETIVGYELGMINNKTNGYIGYGYDCVNLGTYGIGNAFQSRGDFNIAFASYTGANYGFVSYDAVNIGFYASTGTVGLLAEKNNYGVQVNDPINYAYLLQNNSSFVTGMDDIGRWQTLKYQAETIQIGGTLSKFCVIAFSTAFANGDTIYLPASNFGAVIYIRNLSPTYSLFASGSVEDKATGISIPAKTTVQLYSDGTYWYPLSKYSA